MFPMSLWCTPARSTTGGGPRSFVPDGPAKLNVIDGFRQQQNFRVRKARNERGAAAQRCSGAAAQRSTGAPPQRRGGAQAQALATDSSTHTLKMTPNPKTTTPTSHYNPSLWQISVPFTTRRSKTQEPRSITYKVLGKGRCVIKRIILL